MQAKSGACLFVVAVVCNTRIMQPWVMCCDPHLADGGRREEVLQVEMPVVLIREVVRAQSCAGGTERGNRQRLRLAACEQGAAVRPRQDACAKRSSGEQG